ncbi:MAG: CoA pyrophosphatase [Alphaproteobacteria bacterium]|nr:CoA pyrophosphatase [Alphaproteobacteria bacterium]MBF0128739.1 CoA pyrophosphatase [Alphaproteobacteria bacterium]
MTLGLDAGVLPPAGVLTPAAVLVPLVDHDDGFTVLMTRRTDHLAHHGGQVCFPGGRVEDADESMIATALRETSEEIGLDERTVRLIGLLDDCETVTGFLVRPVVGLVTPPLEMRIDPNEVAYAFEMPLSVLLDPDSFRLMTITHRGKEVETLAILYDGHTIWGATARILMSLHRILRAP